MRKTVHLKDTLFDVDQIQAIKEIEESKNSGMTMGYDLHMIISGKWISIRYSKESEAKVERELLVKIWMNDIHE
jgi:hypothetical protein